MTLGERIQKLRKQNGLSQEALAEKVTVTRQTISKWELNQSTPDLDFIAQLSDLFHVSSDYLIRDELTSPDELPTKKKNFHFTAKSKRALLAAVTLAGLAAVLVCLIVDYFTAEHLTWSLIAAAAITAAWFVTLPVLAAKEKILFKTLLAICIVPFPLLAVLALVLKNATIFTLGACITLVCAAAIWGIYKLLFRFRHRLWRAFGFSLLVLLPVPILITQLVAVFLPQYPADFTSNLFHFGITIVLSLVCFGVDYLRQQKQEDASKP